MSDYTRKDGISWCTTAVVRLEILTFPKTDINLSGNFSYMFRQLPLLFTIDYYAC